MKNISYLMTSLVFITLMISCENDSNTAEETIQNEAKLDYVPGEVLVKLKPATKTSNKLVSRAKILALINGSVIETINTNAMISSNAKKGINDGDLLLLSSKLGTMEAIELLKSSDEVEYAEPNWIYQHTEISNDLYYTNNSLWGMYGDATSPANQFGSQAGEAWATGKIGSKTVYIGIIDEGVQFSHEDLAANFWTNPFDPVDGIDNDGNGYKDDVRGWDFDGNNNTVYDGTIDDHGTHVAGTIGAVGGNGKGVAGVNWNVTLISAKFLGRRGGTAANSIKAIDYFTDLKVRHNLNIVATNNSWGGGGFSQGVQDAIERANAANILFCAAAGNGGFDQVGDNNDNIANYPSNYPNANIIAVASITSTGSISSFSNFGPTKVDIGAPGSAVFSTLPNSTRNKYGSYSGTSMATPHVAGACALYASINPGSSAAAIKAAILNSAVPTSSLSGKCVTGGRLNVSGF